MKEQLSILKEKVEEAQVQSKPVVNPHSQKLLNNKQDHTPIYKRYHSEMEQQNSHKQKLKEQYEQMEALKNPEPSFKPEINPTSKAIIGQRTFEDFLNDNQNWLEQRHENKQTKLYESLIEQELDLTMHPSINSKSDRIMLKKDNDFLLRNEKYQDKRDIKLK